MKILVINCGSSSLKYQLIDMKNESVLAKGLVERIGIKGSNLVHKRPGQENYKVEKNIPTHKEAIQEVIKALTDEKVGVIKSVDEISAVGHRVVHAGEKYAESVVIDKNVMKAVKECIDLAPLHNPANIIGIEACEAAMPGKKNVAVFDTAFGMAMPAKAYMYAIPRKYYDKFAVRRYGFHGTSHMFVSQEAMKLGKLNKKNAKIIVCHLGNGASVSASIGGKCVDSSMGLAPLEGLIMGTRSGDIDPSVIQFICNHDKIDINKALDILNKESGILGLSGVSSDFRDVRAAAADGNVYAQEALEAYYYRVAKYIGAYTAAMNGVDAICFTAGVGENNKFIRKEICKYLGYLGIKISDKKNDVMGEPAIISTPASAVKVMVIPTNEELMIARETKRLVK